MGTPLSVIRPHADPIQATRNQWVDAQMSTPPINDNAVTQFLVLDNAATQGVDVSFRITNSNGVKSLSLLRAGVQDITQAIVLQTWTASESSFTWSDTDSLLQQLGQAFYWIKLEPVNALNGKEVAVGPQFILLNPSLLPPVALADVSASHAAAVNGTVLVTCNVAGIDSADGDSVKIYVTGYLGNPSPVAVAQKASAPLQFTLEATGETITIKAIAVSSGGAQAASGPTCTLTLNGSATAPAKIEGLLVNQLSTGNQVQWPSSLEIGVTSYQLWRGQRGGGFGAATLLATVSASSAGTIIYLDTAGLTGDWEYYVIAVSGAGNSPASNAANPQVLYSSSQIPPNVPTNTNNNATVDSIDAGSNATARIYGPGGVGTSYTRYTGFGSLTRAAGTVTGLAYSTAYYIMFHAGSFLATTTYINTLPDGYEWVGKLTTCAAGGGGGSSGGGGGGVSGGCVEEGTAVKVPGGTIEVLEPCNDWIVLDLGDGPLKMHPDTLVSVWKKAKDLRSFDMVEVKGAGWRKPQALWMEYRPGTKVKRTCPGGTYHAGPSLARLHNAKVL